MSARGSGRLTPTAREKKKLMAGTASSRTSTLSKRSPAARSPFPSGSDVDGASSPSNESSYYIEGPWEQRNQHFKNVLLHVCSFILILEFAERVSYYGINQGLKNYMGKLGWTQAGSNSLKSTWTSICYLSPLLGGYIADEKWGRYKTLWVFGIWYTIGAFFVSVSAHPKLIEVDDTKILANVICHIGLFGGIAIGTGAIKANMLIFGADQFDPNDPNEMTQSNGFFLYFNHVVNAGALVSYGYLSILCVTGSGLVPKEYGYFVTFAICGGVMVLAIALFVFAYPRYVHFTPQQSALTQIFEIVNGNCEYSKEARMLRYGLIAFAIAFPVNLVAAFVSNVGSSGQYLSYVVVVCCLFGMYAWIRYGMHTAYMDKSKASNGGRFNDETVDEIKMVIRVLPFACFMIMWECTYDQLDANFQSIAQQCDLRLTRNPEEHNMQVPGAMLSVFDPITAIFLVPTLDKLVYPFYGKMVGRPPGLYGKVLTGLTVAMVTMFWAGSFEVIRRSSDKIMYYNSTGVFVPALDTGSNQPMSDISWGYAVPMYVMISVAGCLIYGSAFELIYNEVPMHLKSTCQVISMFTLAMGSNLTSTFTLIFQDYIRNDLDKGHFEYMYFTLGALSLINIAAYVVVMQWMDFGVVDVDNDAELVEGSSVVDHHHREGFTGLSSFESISFSRG
ncbi:Proton-dependent oligopeptide transporter [Globisporangium polare]